MAEVDTPEFIDTALQLYHAEVRKSIRAQEQRLQQLRAAHDQLQQAIATVQELPLKLRHEVMVPFGKHAFFPGQLTHTNELVVHLGDQYYVETTAAAAKDILQRKLAVIADGVQKAEKQLQSLQARLDVTGSSLRDDSSNQDAIEIRSTLEESETLLASAKRTNRQQQQQHQQPAKVVAGTKAQQQQQQQLARVTTPSGYSYTPIGTPHVPDRGLTQQQQQQQGLGLDDFVLQARLEQLMRLEEQEDLAEQQWQQQQQHASLATIDEGDEDQENGQAAASSAMLDAAQRMQQLEAEADSDDEEEELCFQQQPQQHIAAVGGVMDRLEGQSQQQQQRQGQAASLWSEASSSSALPAAARPQAAAAVPAVTAGKKPLKSALKKGFLTAAASQSQPVSAASSVKGVSNSLTQQRRGADSPAFTGAVIERPSLPEQAAVESAQASASGVAPAMSAVLESSDAAAEAQSMHSADSSGGGRISKFKLRRMGLEPPGE